MSALWGVRIVIWCATTSAGQKYSWIAPPTSGDLSPPLELRLGSSLHFLSGENHHPRPEDRLRRQNPLNRPPWPTCPPSGTRRPRMCRKMTKIAGLSKISTWTCWRTMSRWKTTTTTTHLSMPSSHWRRHRLKLISLNKSQSRSAPWNRWFLQTSWPRLWCCTTMAFRQAKRRRSTQSAKSARVSSGSSSTCAGPSMSFRAPIHPTSTTWLRTLRPRPTGRWLHFTFLTKQRRLSVSTAPPRYEMWSGRCWPSSGLLTVRTNTSFTRRDRLSFNDADHQRTARLSH